MRHTNLETVPGVYGDIPQITISYSSVVAHVVRCVLYVYTGPPKFKGFECSAAVRMLSAYICEVLLVFFSMTLTNPTEVIRTTSFQTLVRFCSFIINILVRGTNNLTSAAAAPVTSKLASLLSIS